MIGRYLLGGTTFIMGAVLPLLLVLALWMIGSPPASSVFWTKAEVTLAGYEAMPTRVGGVAADIMLPKVTDAAGQSRTLILATAIGPEADAFRAAHPVGTRLTVRLAPGGGTGGGPSGAIAYLSGPGQAWLISAIIATVLGLLMVFSVLSGLFRKDARPASPA
jgi:hypothetical protein